MTPRAREQSARQFRLLADAMPQLVWMADADGVVTYYNSRASEYAGLSPDDTGNWDWVPAVHPDDSALTLEAWMRAVNTLETYQCEHRILAVLAHELRNPLAPIRK